MSLFYQPAIPEGVLELDPDESRHATRVLRLKVGDTLQVTDGKGKIYNARVTDPAGPVCTFRILETIVTPRLPWYRHIAIAPTKNTDRIEWFVEKAVELGVDEISFFTSRTSERKSLNMERIEKIALSAMKQSQQAWFPALAGLKSFRDVISIPADQKFIAFVDKQNPDHLKAMARPSGHILILIGPEGDFTNEELQEAIKTGFRKVSLGNNRLRTETAGLAACHILSLI